MFLQRFRAFSQHAGHFATLRRAFLAHTENYTFRNTLVLPWEIFPSTTGSRLSDEEEVLCKFNRLYFVLYYLKTIVIQKQPLL